MLNPLADNAQRGEYILGVWIHPGATGADLNGVVAAALAGDNDFIPGGPPSTFVGASGTGYVACAMRVPNISDGKLYDSLLRPIAHLPLGFLSGELTLAFVDYANNVNDAYQVGQTVAQADQGTSLTDDLPYLTAFDSVGALSPYVQKSYAPAVAAEQAKRSAIGAAANVADKAAQAVKDLSIGGAVTILLALAATVVAARVAGAVLEG